MSANPEPPADPQHGDVDPRWLLANERTLLAWIRAGLAIQAGALAVAEFATGPPHWLRGTIAAALIAIGVLVSALGHHHSRQVKHAMANGTPIPEATALNWICMGIVALGVILGTAVIRHP
jgi:putative membrane protein